MDSNSIWIVGGPYLQNQLLCNYLSSKLGKPCRVADRRQSRRAAAADLLLLDYQDDEFHGNLGVVLEHTHAPTIALFQVPERSDLGDLIGQPQLKGVFFDTASEALLGTASKRCSTASCGCRARRWPTTCNACAGARSGDIAAGLGLSLHTVKTPIPNIFKKIEANSRLEAVNGARANALA